jgi:pyruvate ferredoxin oxidoreductase alpha subunit
MRELGEAVGLLKLRLWRPFPFEEFRRAVEGIETLLVIDRAVSFGGPGGPVASELKSALYHQKKPPRVVNVIAGLAGRDVQPDDFEQMVEQAKAKVAQGKEDDYLIYGVRA